MVRKNSELIDDRLVRALKVGEKPYQANRAAVRSLDIEGDVKKGDAHLKGMLGSMNAFINELEGIADVADGVVRGLSSSIH